MHLPPFMSQEGKWSPEKESIKKNIPGPGAYSLAGDLNKGTAMAIGPLKLGSEKGICSLFNL